MSGKGGPRGLSTGIETASLKRLAWAYGCAKKGSDEERLLLARLKSKVDEDPVSHEDEELIAAGSHPASSDR